MNEELALRLFLCGDVMPGRGMDQVLPQSCEPTLHEPWVEDARTYWRIAETANGEIPAPVQYGYVWGDALRWLQAFAPHRRLINLETTVTCSEDWWRAKDIHYRMHPSNVRVLTAAGIDACSLANNHILDWGHAGLEETLATIHASGISSAGAGTHLAGAQALAVLDAGANRRVLVLAFGSGSSGIPGQWAAGDDRSGVWRIDENTQASVDEIGRRVAAARNERDVVVASIHWGGNWDYQIPDAQRRFARALIDVSGVDVIHGHSSHHPKGIEVYRGRLVLYGCGDLLSDYEGIRGHGAYRPELTLMYFPEVEPRTGRLLRLAMRPMRIRRFRLEDANEADAQWLLDRMERECRKLGTGVRRDEAGTFWLEWDDSGERAVRSPRPV